MRTSERHPPGQFSPGEAGRARREILGREIGGDAVTEHTRSIRFYVILCRECPDAEVTAKRSRVVCSRDARIGVRDFWGEIGDECAARLNDFGAEADEPLHPKCRACPIANRSMHAHF